MPIHQDIISLIIAYTLTGAFVFTVFITCLSLLGWVKFASSSQQSKLFVALILEVVVIGIGTFAGFLEFDAFAAQQEVVVEAQKHANNFPVPAREGFSVYRSTQHRVGFAHSELLNLSPSYEEVHLGALTVPREKETKGFGSFLNAGTVSVSLRYLPKENAELYEAEGDYFNSLVTNEINELLLDSYPDAWRNNYSYIKNIVDVSRQAYTVDGKPAEKLLLDYHDSNKSPILACFVFDAKDSRILKVIASLPEDDREGTAKVFNDLVNSIVIKELNY